MPYLGEHLETLIDLSVSTLCYTKDTKATYKGIEKHEKTNNPRFVLTNLKPQKRF